MALKYFNKTSYNTLGDALGAIQKELESMQMIDSKDIKWVVQANGRQAILTSTNVGGAQPSEPVAMENPTTAVTYEYNSFFKIVDSSITNEDGSVVNMISVIDGRDRGKNCVKVNNSVYYIQYLNDKVVTESSIIALCFDAKQKAVTYTLVSENILPDDTAEFSWYQIGEVIISDGTITIYQDHLSGVAQMFWYDICGD